VQDRTHILSDALHRTAAAAVLYYLEPSLVHSFAESTASSTITLAFTGGCSGRWLSPEQLGVCFQCTTLSADVFRSAGMFTYGRFALAHPASVCCIRVSGVDGFWPTFLRKVYSARQMVSFMSPSWSVVFF